MGIIITNTFYLQIQSDNIITDIVDYSYDGYVEVELETPLPSGINGGWWKYENGELIEIPELKPISERSELMFLKAKIQQQEDALFELAELLGGVVE